MNTPSIDIISLVHCTFLVSPFTARLPISQSLPHLPYPSTTMTTRLRDRGPIHSTSLWLWEQVRSSRLIRNHCPICLSASAPPHPHHSGRQRDVHARVRTLDLNNLVGREEGGGPWAKFIIHPRVMTSNIFLKRFLHKIAKPQKE
jgi:hypothetical protein